MPGPSLLPKIHLQNPSKVVPQSHITSSTTKRVNFYHPAYDRKDGLLFVLYAFDATGGGIHYGLAHDACAIIADNRHDGWLTATRDGERIEAHWDDILPLGNYWYHVPDKSGGTTIISDAPYRWPVVTCFQDFEFPETLPDTWSRIILPESPVNTGSQSTYSSLTRARDITCRISNHATGVQVAHICPEHERDWFMSNSMPQYNSNISLDPQNLLNDMSNLILLRSDLHTAFDDRKFVIYPKDGNVDSFVVHMLEPTSDIGSLYHNSRTHPIHACRIQFLYARFAWSIFPAISGFLSNSSINKAVIMVKQEGGRRIRLVEEVLDAEQLRAKASQSRSRSPRKRQRAPGLSEVVEADEKPHIKRPCNSFTSLIGIDDYLSSPSADLDEDSGSSPVSFTTLDAQPSVHRTTNSDITDLMDLKEKFLNKQRPSEYVPFQGSVFEGTTDPKEILTRLGVEIRDDPEDEKEREPV